MTHLLVITVGPVQDFIAAARKTRDLWAGSELLSEVSKAVALSLPLIRDEDLIFPTANAARGKAPVANIVLAMLPDGDPQEIVQRAEEAALGVLKSKFDDALATIRTRLGSDLLTNDLKALAKKQIKDFLEFYAAWVPMDGEYAKDRKAVMRLLAGRKALRDFKPAHGMAGRPKSALDGGRESVLPEHIVKSGCPQLGIKKGEHLDGISLLKRTAKMERFVSTARVAVDPLIRRLVEEKQTELLQELRKMAEELIHDDLAQKFPGHPQYAIFPYDTELFYNDGKAEANSEDVKNKASAFFKQVQSACKDRHLGDPPAYFAVLQGDGDRMGATLNQLDTPTAHQLFSDNLLEFSDQAKSIVEDEYYGALIYSGGDDVLALLPLDTALSCATALNTAFTKCMDAALPDDFPAKPTFSCGVSIGHYSEHLQRLLAWARDAERAAKDAGRNRLAVHLHTRTAGECCVGAVHTWADTSRWEKWTTLLVERKIPTGAIFELRKLAREFAALGSAHAGFLREEIRRILARKHNEGGKLSKEEIEPLVTAAGDTPALLERLVDELLIARRLADARRISPQEKVTP